MTSPGASRMPRRAGMMFLGIGVVVLGGIAVVLGPSELPEPRPHFQEFYDYGLAHSRPGLWADALPAFKWATRIDPRQTMAHYHLAQAYFNVGDPENALKATNVLLQDPEHRRRVEKSPVFHLLWSSRAHCRSATGDYEGSEADFHRALALDPGNAEYHYYLCWTQLELSRLDDALASGLKALQLGYKNHKSLAKVGMVYKKLGDYESAVRYFEEALRHHSGYTSAYKNLAQSLIKLGRVEEGKRHHEIARLLAEIDDEYRKFKQKMSLDEDMTEEEFFERSDDFVRFCFHYWKYPELEEWMEQLLVRDPENPLWQFRMGFARSQLKKEKEAEEHFRHVLLILGAKRAQLNMMGQGLDERDRVLHRDTCNALGLLLATADSPLVRKPVEALFWAREARRLGWPGTEVEAAALEAMGETEAAVEKIDEQLRRKGGNRQLLKIQREEFLKRLQRKELKPPK